MKILYFDKSIVTMTQAGQTTGWYIVRLIYYPLGANLSLEIDRFEDDIKRPSATFLGFGIKAQK